MLNVNDRFLGRIGGRSAAHRPRKMRSASSAVSLDLPMPGPAQAGLNERGNDRLGRGCSQRGCSFVLPLDRIGNDLDTPSIRKRSRTAH